MIKYNFIIITSELIKSIAIQLSHLLNNLNYKTEIKYLLSDEDINNPVNSYTKYIIIFNNRIDFKFPKKYILYQIEQSNYYVKNNHINQKELFNSAEYIWDFSIKNFNIYNKFIESSKIFYFPMPFYCKNIINKEFNKKEYEYEYDIFFYGSENERRRNILNKLSKKYKIKNEFIIFDNERDKYIQSSKIILNLHYYDDAALETCRFNEILQFNTPIISETSNNDEYNKYIYKEYITFVDCIKDDLSNIDILYSAIDILLNNKLYITKRNKIKKNKSKLTAISEYFLKKNLLQIIKPINI